MRRIYVKEEVCMGCGLCRVYCQVTHSRSKDVIKAFKKESPRTLPRIRVERRGEISFAVACRQCEEPWCVYACLTGAMSRDTEKNTINIAADRCIGCWTCVVACPYGALSMNKASSRVVKCDLCPEEMVPACVAHCPNEALLLSVDDEEPGSVSS